MKILSTLSPAEALIVLQDQQVTMKDILKVTFMDLLLKQVLRTLEVEKQAHKNDQVRYFKYVEAGKNFNVYQALPHEQIFLWVFEKHRYGQILFRHIVKIAYQKSRFKIDFLKQLMNSPQIAGCFKQNIFQQMFGGFKLTDDGMALRVQIRAEIDELEKTLPVYIANDRQKALKMLKTIKGNIFLLHQIDFDVFEQIDKELLAEMNQEHDKNTNGGDSGCTWHSFDAYSDTFDSSCSGSGCSGDGGSGCGGAGCSGCGGGCGGCGS